MIIMTVREDDGRWAVWVGLDEIDPRINRFGFCLSVADTRDDAIAEAVAELEAATDQLQQPESMS